MMKTGCVDRILILAAIIPLFGLFFASCNRGPSAEEKLKNRVVEYWKLKAEKKFADAYNLEYPPFKKMVTIEKYIASFNPEASTGVPKIEEIKINKDGTATVDLKMPVSLKPPFIKKPFEVNVTTADKWIMIDGDWYHVPTPKKQRTFQERG